MTLKAQEKQSAKRQLKKIIGRVELIQDLEEHFKTDNRPPKIESPLGRRCYSLFNTSPWRTYLAWTELKEDMGIEALNIKIR